MIIIPSCKVDQECNIKPKVTNAVSKLVKKWRGASMTKNSVLAGTGFGSPHSGHMGHTM